MIYKNDNIEINKKDILIAYEVISTIMKNNKLTADSSWRHVQCWLSNKYCDLQLKEKNESKL